MDEAIDRCEKIKQFNYFTYFNYKAAR
jgi:Asp-tRNA(Asn)/Glu-tRNA(Gln) amidotransferase A subunit family amidase